MQRKFYQKRKQVNIKKIIQLMTITELVLLILNFTSCIVCLWLSLLKQKLNTTRSMCNVERASPILHCYTITIETN